jgi:hypothetical protein
MDDQAFDTIGPADAGDRSEDQAEDQALAGRLQAFEASVPVVGGPPSRRPRVSRGRVALAAIAAVALVAGGATASGVFQAQGHEGAFNPGQALHCKGVANMTPRDAATWLSDHGYDVTWQVEDRTPGVAKGQQTSYQTKDAPSRGSIAGAVVIKGHEMIVVVETGSGAIRADDCP